MTLPALRSSTPWAAAALLGLGLGLLWAWGWGLARSTGSPQGWQRERTELPVRSPEVVGSLPLTPWAWSLDHHELLLAPEGTTTLGIEGLVPPSARLELLAPAGVRLSRERGPGAWWQLRMEPASGTHGPQRISLGRDAREPSQATAGNVERPTLRVGPERVWLRGLGPPPLRPRTLALALVAGAGLLLGAAGLQRRGGLSWRTVLPPWLGLLAGLLLLTVDPSSLAQALRVQALDTPWLALLAGLGCTGLLLLATWTARLARGGRWAALLLPALAFPTAGLAAGQGAPGLLAGLAVLGASLGLLLVVNVNAARVRAFNWISLAAVAGAVGGAELALEHSATGAAWTQAYAWSLGWGATPPPDQQTMANRDFLELERGRHQAYPGRGYPVAFRPKEAPTRVVAFGGSSTGGAFRNDSLDEFFPARLAALLGPEVEVVNQGVGGWTTFHIRRYAEARLAELEPDVVLLYIGNNDSAAITSASYAQLHERWERRRGLDGVAGPLRRSQLNRGLTVLLAGRPGADRVASVSLPEARENLEALVSLCRGLGARTLLVGEGHAGADVTRLQPYHALMRLQAERGEGLRWLDGHGVLQRAGPGMFLDDVHLSDAGHQALADALAQELRAAGWAPPPAQAE